MPARSTNHPVSARVSRETDHLLLRLGLTLALLGLALGAAWNTRRPDLSTRQEKAEQYTASFDALHPLGQTFVARQDRLSALQFFGRLAPGALDSAASLTLRLKESPASATDLLVQHAPLSALRSGAALMFSFPPQASAGRPLFILLETDAPPGQVALFTSRSDAYFDGDLYLDGQPTGRDLAFRAYTAPDGLGWLRSLLAARERIGWMAGFTLFFALLGGSLLFLLGAPPPGALPEDKVHRLVEWLATAVVCGVSIGPIVWTVCTPFHVRLDAPVLQGAFAGVLLLALCKGLLQRLVVPSRPSPAPRPSSSQPSKAAQSSAGTLESGGGWPSALAFVGLFVLALGGRALQIEDVAVPLWVDGLTHAATVQAILQTGGLSNAGFLYHIGFHINVAELYAFTGLPSAELILIYGQWLGVLSGFSLYLLAAKLFGLALHSRPAVRAAALSSAMGLFFFAQFPAGLINWGRYPFMQGLTLLPAALAVTLDAFTQRKPANTALALILVAGLFLSHYGMASFWLTFVVTWACWRAWDQGTLRAVLRRPFHFPTIRIKPWMMLAFGLALLILLALGVRLASFWPASVLAAMIAQSRQNVEELNLAQILAANFRSGGLWLGLAGLGGLILAAFRYRPVLLLTAGCFLAQAAFIALQSPLFGEALASYTNLLLALSLPLSLLAGLLCGELAAFAFPPASPQKRAPKTPAGALPHLRTGAALSFAALAIAGSFAQWGIVTPATVLFTPADRQAVQWIRANTPAPARFLVNSNYWGALKQKTVPSDGGGWIEALTGRPVEFLQNEQDLQNIEQFLRLKQIDYIYLGGFPGFLDQALLSAAAPPPLLESLELVYQKDGVRIFHRRPSEP